MSEVSVNPGQSSVVPALVRTRLSVMMFMQYAIWGAWLPILYPFLLGHRGFSLNEVGAVLAGGAAGAIAGPFIAGQIADRFFATEKFLALSHLAGAVLVWFLATIDTFAAFMALSVVYGIVYAPTLALTNSISFHHLPDRERDFGKVRLWGTVGWIAAGILVGQWLATRHTPDAGDLAAIEAAQNAGRADAFKLSALLGVVMGVYCFTLPSTPPAKSAESNASLKALKEAKSQPLLTLFLLAVPISIIHQFYFVHASSFLTGVQNRAGGSAIADAINSVLGVGGGGLMTIGQMTEIAVMATIPFVAKKVGWKALLATGIVAYAARMAIFAYLPDGDLALPLAIVGVAMHGLCFGCFIFVAFMVVDENSTADVRASAQNLFNLVFVGLGIIVGSWFATSVVANWAMGDDGVMDYTKLFSVPLWMSVVCLAALLVAYPSKRALAARRASEPEPV
ncbi:MAG: MFS transporter [Planctomycetota bacterium]